MTFASIRKSHAAREFGAIDSFAEPGCSDGEQAGRHAVANLRAYSDARSPRRCEALARSSLSEPRDRVWRARPRTAFSLPAKFRDESDATRDLGLFVRALGG